MMRGSHMNFRFAIFHFNIHKMMWAEHDVKLAASEPVQFRYCDLDAVFIGDLFQLTRFPFPILLLIYVVA